MNFLKCTIYVTGRILEIIHTMTNTIRYINKVPNTCLGYIYGYDKDEINIFIIS